MKSIGSVPLVAISGSDIALFLGGEPPDQELSSEYARILRTSGDSPSGSGSGLARENGFQKSPKNRTFGSLRKYYLEANSKA